MVVTVRTDLPTGVPMPGISVRGVSILEKNSDWQAFLELTRMYPFLNEYEIGSSESDPKQCILVKGEYGVVVSIERWKSYCDLIMSDQTTALDEELKMLFVPKKKSESR